jgi:hypothetical protein
MVSLVFFIDIILPPHGEYSTLACIHLQLVKKFPAFYGTRRFITAFTSAHTSLYPKPAQSSAYSHIPLPEDPPYYYPPIYTWISPVVSFPKVSSPKPCTNLFAPPSSLYAQAISLFSILSIAQYWVSSTDHEGPHYEVFSTPLLSRPS